MKKQDPFNPSLAITNSGGKLRPIALDLINTLFILLFLYAALSKIKDFNDFEIQLAKSPILSSIYALVAFSVPAVEVIIIGLLLFKRFRFIGLVASFSLMVAFTAYIIVILNFSENIPCSCGGILENMSWHQHLIFNLLFVALSAFAVMIYPIRSQEIIAQ